MEWNRTEKMMLASDNCIACQGEGTVVGSDGAEKTCKCVLRAIFRACYDRFRECSFSSISDSRISLEHAVSSDGPTSWGLKNEEYTADFLQVAKKNLSPEEHTIFRYRYLLGADWRLCCRKLGNMDKGAFHHTCYRIQHKLGRVFMELQPYPLYPLNEYFSGGMRSETSAKIIAMRPKATAPASNIPVRKAA